MPPIGQQRLIGQPGLVLAGFSDDECTRGNVSGSQQVADGARDEAAAIGRIKEDEG